MEKQIVSFAGRMGEVTSRSLDVASASVDAFSDAYTLADATAATRRESLVSASNAAVAKRLGISEAEMLKLLGK